MIGKVLDSSAVIAIARGDIIANSWVTVAWDNAHILSVPVLALAETRELRPDLALVVDDFAQHPSVVVHSLADQQEPLAAAVEQLLEANATCDVLAGHVVHLAAKRGWPVLTADPTRLRRLDPDVEVTLI